MARAFRMRGGLAWVGCLVVMVALVLPLFAAALVLAGSPQQGDRFEYDYNTDVDQGAGDYSGYSDHMRSHSTYVVQGIQGDRVTVRGTGGWVFDASDGTHQSGSVDVTPVFSLATRRYLSGIDVNTTDRNATVWFWVPTGLTAGQVLHVLDDQFNVASTDATVWLGLVPHKSVLLQASGTYARNDAYGKFAAAYQDRYYFDRDSGYIIAETFDERDTNAVSSFHYHAEIHVTSTSYAIPLDPVSFALVDFGIPASAVAIVAAIIRVRRGPSRFSVGSKDFPKEVRIRKAKSPADLANLTPDGSPFFGPFLPVFAERSIAEGDPVVLAIADRQIAGLALFDRESGLGSLFASDDVIARVLHKRLRMRDFFADGTIPGRILRAKEIDRFTILQLQNPSAVAYDSDVVRPMAAQDLPAVIAIAEEVYRGRARRFIESSFQGGDLGFVATSTLGGRLAGFGFATAVGTVARLHTLTVAVADRAKGIGTEITNARLSALSALGVDRVMVEISKQNVASLRIATRAGFAPVGETIYYSRRPEVAPTALQRQT